MDNTNAYLGSGLSDFFITFLWYTQFTPCIACTKCEEISCPFLWNLSSSDSIFLLLGIIILLAILISSFKNETIFL